MLIIYINVYRNIGLNEKHYTVRTVPISNRKIVETDKDKLYIINTFLSGLISELLLKMAKTNKTVDIEFNAHGTFLE